MATIWLKQTDTCRYEVRTAGNSVRLYSNGVFHSQWNAKKPLNGHLWDLLFLPLCWHPSFPNFNTALILGLGGGTVINLMQCFTKFKKIVAVDLDEQHFYVAKEFFKVADGQAKVEFIQDDAVHALEQQSDKFDFILEDLFINEGQTSNAIRAVEASDVWLQNLLQKLSDSGLLLMNFESLRQVRSTFKPKLLKQLGVNTFIECSLPRYENVVVALSKANLNAEDFQTNIASLEQSASFNSERMAYHFNRRI